MIKAIIFDFDGTIIDSNKATVNFLQETFRYFNLRIPEKEEITHLFGYKIPDILKQLLPDFKEEKLQEVFEYSIKLSILAVSDVILIPDVHAVLNELKKKFKMAVFTSRSKETMKMLLPKFDLDKYFVSILDREDVTHHKPHPEGILKNIEKLQLKLNESIYVGDARLDVETAHNAGIPCILISYKTDHYGADYHIDSIKKLPKLMHTITEKK